VRHSDELRTVFGFNDKILGDHVERAYQALALDETRADFSCAMFEQSQKGKEKNQILKQCWFSGSHSDIGGGYPEHDLSDITLTWMVSQVSDILSVDTSYLVSLFRPVKDWGKSGAHDPRVGVFALSRKNKRPIPKRPNDVTQEFIHKSVLEQDYLDPDLATAVKQYPQLVVPLTPLEQEVKSGWQAHPQGVI